jgi:hypothetical protein
MAQEIRKPMAGGAPASRYQDPFAEMRAEMDRLFDTFLGRGFFGRPAPSAMAQPAATVAPSISGVRGDAGADQSATETGSIGSPRPGNGNIAQALPAGPHAARPTYIP